MLIYKYGCDISGGSFIFNIFLCISWLHKTESDTAFKAKLNGTHAFRAIEFDDRSLIVSMI